MLLIELEMFVLYYLVAFNALLAAAIIWLFFFLSIYLLFIIRLHSSSNQFLWMLLNWNDVQHFHVYVLQIRTIHF